MLTIVALLVILGVVVRAMTPEERMRVLRIGLAYLRLAREEATYVSPEREQFHDALRTRTRWALVTPVLAALNAAIFLFMLFGAGSLSDPATLVGWGASYGPRTTNGEWWRLLTSMFVHAGLLQLLINVGALVQLGNILERLVGRLTFAAVYVAAGLFASLISLSDHPMAVAFGASAAIFGLYGLLVASAIWSMLPRSSVTIPLTSAIRLALVALVFLVYNMANDSLAMAADLTGLATGLAAGLALTRGISEHEPAPRRIAFAAGAAVVLAAVCAFPLRGIIDVRPEIDRVIAVEDRTASTYQTELNRFRIGKTTTDALANLIDRKIVPELQATGERLKGFDNVPLEHQPLVAGAEEYVRLRCKSWRLRAEGLRRFNGVPDLTKIAQAPRGNSRAEAARYRATMRTFGQAEATERASLEALERIRQRG